jgi:hypothetical protein
MKKNEDFFIFREKKDDYMSKLEPENAEYTIFIAIKFSNDRIDEIADKLKVYGDLDCSNIRA